MINAEIMPEIVGNFLLQQWSKGRVGERGKRRKRGFEIEVMEVEEEGDRMVSVKWSRERGSERGGWREGDTG